VDRHRVTATDDKWLPIPCGPTLSERQTGVPTRRVVVIEKVPVVDLESSRAETTAELETCDQYASTGQMRGTSSDERGSIRDRAEQWDVPGHHHDIERAAEVEGSQVGLYPRQAGCPTASFGNHRRVDVDPNDFDAVLGQLDGYPSRTTSCVED
jgi:hypothetical protein